MLHKGKKRYSRKQKSKWNRTCGIGRKKIYSQVKKCRFTVEVMCWIWVWSGMAFQFLCGVTVESWMEFPVFFTSTWHWIAFSNTSTNYAFGTLKFLRRWDEDPVSCISDIYTYNDLTHTYLFIYVCLCVIVYTL